MTAVDAWLEGHPALYMSALADQLRDRRVVRDADAEVAACDALQPASVAFERRMVEAELVDERLARFGGCRFAEHHVGGVARQNVQHREDDRRRDQQRGHECREALEQKEADDGTGNVERFGSVLIS